MWKIVAVKRTSDPPQSSDIPSDALIGELTTPLPARPSIATPSTLTRVPLYGNDKRYMKSELAVYDEGERAAMTAGDKKNASSAVSRDLDGHAIVPIPLIERKSPTNHPSEASALNTYPIIGVTETPLRDFAIHGQWGTRGKPKALQEGADVIFREPDDPGQPKNDQQDVRREFQFRSFEISRKRQLWPRLGDLQIVERTEEKCVLRWARISSQSGPRSKDIHVPGGTLVSLSIGPRYFLNIDQGIGCKVHKEFGYSATINVPLEKIQGGMNFDPLNRDEAGQTLHKFNSLQVILKMSCVPLMVEDVVTAVEVSDFRISE
ncbi:hypothetical protein ARMSODRAFT_1000626 [Armillaria solidipes]|uniref:Uncharacterized protein n=1 Tax=Armillaria solidipes TaxID=1076256 RepID=A0A2H3BZ74_9AGAR|nr:hypothetical protein ARMSODRAFT_1000626 [Armillaria solidipes]